MDENLRCNICGKQLLWNKIFMTPPLGTHMCWIPSVGPLRLWDTVVAGNRFVILKIWTISSWKSQIYCYFGLLGKKCHIATNGIWNQASTMMCGPRGGAPTLISVPKPKIQHSSLTLWNRDIEPPISCHFSSWNSDLHTPNGLLNDFSC